MRTTRITGTGSALPKKTVTNEQLSRIVDTSDEWIRTRTGIGERQIAGNDETVVSLAVKAGERALENSGTTGEEIQLVLVATCSSEYHFPSVSCQVQEKLNLKSAAAMDISAACAGFLYGLQTAHAYISAGIYDKILIIGSETLSRTIDWSDRSTCVLFGDGAGACVAEADEEGILSFVQRSDGSGASVLSCKSVVKETPASDSFAAQPLAMDGQEVFRFAVKTVPHCLLEVLSEGQVQPEDVKYYILHQANERILQSVAKRLHLGIEKFPMNLQKHGNTSAASIPILLDEMNREGKLKKGDLLALAGFGAGLTWGAVLLHW